MLQKLLAKLIPLDFQEVKTVDGTPSIPQLIDCSPYDLKQVYAFRINEALRKDGYHEVEFLSDQVGSVRIRLFQDVSLTRLTEIKACIARIYPYPIMWGEKVDDD